MLKIGLFSAISIFSNSAFACYGVSAEMKPSVETMVKSNDDIYLAEVTNINRAAALKLIRQGTLYTFKVTEVIKGKKIETFEVEGLPHSSEPDHDFNSHKDKKFWEQSSAGRSDISPDCQIRPSFEIGKKYLIFPNKPYLFKSFELIKSDEDVLLNKVRALTR